MKPLSDQGKEIAAARREARLVELREVLGDFFEGRPGPVSLELGCGHGHWLTSLAENCLTDALVGVDLISRRIRLAQEKAAKRHLDNVLFLKAEGTEVLDAWPEKVRVSQVFLLHPDPWPKKRHAKNRMTGEKFLTRIARVVGEQGELYFRTDNPDFHSWSKESLENHPDWQLVDLPWPHEAGSYFKDLLGVHGALTARCASLAGG